MSTISTSRVRMTSPTTSGPDGVIRGCSPSNTRPLIITQGESWIVLARGPRPVSRYPPGTSSARCGGANDAAISGSGPSANTSATPASGACDAHQAPVFPAWSAQPAALSNRPTSSAMRATVTGSVSSPPSARGVNIRNNPALRMASSTGRASRRSRSPASACSRMIGSSERARSSRRSSTATDALAVEENPRGVADAVGWCEAVIDGPPSWWSTAATGSTRSVRRAGESS